MNKPFVLKEPEDRQRYMPAITRQVLSYKPEKPIQVEIKLHQNNRSTKQNKLYWKWLNELVEHIADSTGQRYSSDDLHDYFRALYLPQRTIEIDDTVVKARKSTAKLKVQEFTEYLEKIEVYAADSLHCRLSHPDDLYWSALMKELEGAV